MSEQTTLTRINRSFTNKKVNDFYAQFLGLEENISNILGRQVKSIERPTITFNTYEIRNKNVPWSGTSKIEFSDITIRFFDDAGSLTIDALYRQAFKQQAKEFPSGSKMGRFPDDVKFEIKVQCFDLDGNVVESYTMQKCLISAISNSELVSSDSGDNEITVTVAYDTVCYETKDPTELEDELMTTDSVS